MPRKDGEPELFDQSDQNAGTVRRATMQQMTASHSMCTKRCARPCGYGGGEHSVPDSTPSTAGGPSDDDGEVRVDPQYVRLAGSGCLGRAARGRCAIRSLQRSLDEPPRGIGEPRGPEECLWPRSSGLPGSASRRASFMGEGEGGKVRRLGEVPQCRLLPASRIARSSTDPRTISRVRQLVTAVSGLLQVDAGTEPPNSSGWISR